MNIPSWLDEHKNILRFAILTLLITTLIGPWMFDQINVPAQYTCDLPNIRLYGDFCGIPISGYQFFGFLVGGFFQMLFVLITGTFINRPRELLVGLSILPLVPFFTTLLLIWKKESRRLRTINLVAWILAFLTTSTLFIPQINDKVILLWGLWLYIITTVIAIALEIGIQRWERRSGNGA